MKYLMLVLFFVGVTFGSGNHTGSDWFKLSTVISVNKTSISFDYETVIAEVRNSQLGFDYIIKINCELDIIDNDTPDLVYIKPGSNEKLIRDYVCRNYDIYH